MQKRKSIEGTFIRGHFQTGKKKSKMGLEKVPWHNVLSWNPIVKNISPHILKCPCSFSVL